jgi:hypothetical protein
MKNSIAVVTVIGVLVVAIFSYSYLTGGNEMKEVEEIEVLISSNLKKGNTHFEIEHFLESHEFYYVFDENLSRYQARDLSEDSLPDFLGRNLIYINVDDEKMYVDYEVLKIHK